MTDMLKLNRNWKYYLNIASQAFPLKTNAELVKILKAYNGSNDIETFPLSARRLSRSVFIHTSANRAWLIWSVLRVYVCGQPWVVYL